MKLLLSGGGSPNQVVPLDNLFAQNIGQGKVLYVPVALPNESYSDCLKWFTSTYNNFGITDIEMVTNLNNFDIDEYSAVFIGGGNTFKLLKEIKEAKFDEKLIKFLNNGGFVYGGSAGAIIFGKTIKTAIGFDENIVNLTDLNGLNLLNNADIWCHYNDDHKPLIKDYSNELYILYEESGLYIDDNKISSIGKQYLKKEGNANEYK